DEPERALALLDQLRKRTTNGNDLYFLDEAVAAVGERWKDFQQRAEQLRARLFDHIPPPPAELFQWVETAKDGRVSLWCEIPEGSFRMGSPKTEKGRDDDEGPQHAVQVPYSFHLAAVPVTNGQYAAFDSTHQPHPRKGVSDEELMLHPAVNVTWWAAVAFCRWLSTAEWNHGVRLPSEPEWEHACRAGTKSRYWSGDSEKDLKRVGWYNKNSKGRTHRVAEKPANNFGLYDVHGNVREWTSSYWTDDYSGREAGVTLDPSSGEPSSSPPPSAPGRVIRGGFYWLEARDARSAYRFHGVPGSGIGNRGFRVL
ncbi:MAG: formylglycine-generating enzyme family protein, partial [bacterium]|nr:formylglycine-generating enzyme family protein [bacterium]